MKTCKQCSAAFEVTPEDKEFLEKMEVPEPTLCYVCRMQRRLTYRNERHLYHRKCDLTGKQMISAYSTDKPYPVYDNEAWWGDDWDPLEYGRDFDFSRPFFEQFFELRNSVPRLARIQQPPMINSEYCNCASNNKNSYLVFSTSGCEDCYYGSWVNQSKDCVDNTNIRSCELSYDCVGCRDCYNLHYSHECTNCKDSAFLRNCQGCSNCFVCSNLVNKQYCIFNEQKTKEEYEAFMKDVQLGSHNIVAKIKEQYGKLTDDLIVKEFTGTNIENCIGNYLRNCKNVYYGFECDGCEDIRYGVCLQNAKDCMDYSYWGENAERVYDCQACGYGIHNLRFCNLCWNGSSDLSYCDHCVSSEYCFGCTGLKRQKYCIFNKQYSKEEYGELVPKIIEHMKETGEWGEYFPISGSIYGYNESLASEQMPLSKEEILQNGWPYHDEPEREKQYKGPIYQIPDNIKDVPEDITKQILLSEASGKPYKIIPQEFKFYKEQGIPIPRLTPDERHFKRLEKRNKRVIYDRQCQKCKKGIHTTYAPERPEVVYCEQCYLKEVYQMPACSQCTASFEIREKDRAFYNEVSPTFGGKKYLFPEPTICPTCRQQRRLAFRNERQLYRRKCDSSGQDIVSCYSPDKPYKVYKSDEWWSDKWDPLDYGRDFDFNRPFFEQFDELNHKVPHAALITAPDIEENNCLYVNFAGGNKNCYMLFDSDYNEDCYYCNGIKGNKNIVDCSSMQDSELCYECIDCVKCYNLRFSENCTNCSDSAFLKDCTGCRNCLFCVNLHQKEYHIYNKPYSKEEYEKMLAEYPISKRSNIQLLLKKAQEFSLEHPKKYSHIVQSENCSGDYTHSSKDCHRCFDISEARDLAYCDIVHGANDCMDVSSFGSHIERVYECTTAGINCSNMAFCWACLASCSDVYYSIECKQSEHCFGCVGLKHKKYCVFNKQYTKEEYEELVPKIIEHMQKTGEWGQFFPMHLSSFGYNESVAQEYYPLTREEVLQKGWQWSDYESPKPDVKKIIPAERLPEEIKDVPDDILDWAIECERTKRPYRVVSRELSFYRQHNLPVPKLHPDERTKRRMNARNPRQLWDRKCAKCQKDIQSSYAPERKEIVYCEECYVSEVF